MTLCLLCEVEIPDLVISQLERTCTSMNVVYSRHSMGLIPTKKSLQLADDVNASSFCR